MKRSANHQKVIAMNRDEVLKLLKSNIIFEAHEKIDDITDIVHLKKIMAGDVIFKKGEAGSFIVLVLTGTVGVYIEESNGSEVLLTTVEKNSFVGEMATIDDNMKRMATTKAETDTLIGVIYNNDFWNLFSNEPVCANNILKAINKRLRETDNTLILELRKKTETLEKFNRSLEKKVSEKIEELREKDMELLEMDRVAGIGTLASGIAHEINNPLGFLKSTVKSLVKDSVRILDSMNVIKNELNQETLSTEHTKYLHEMNLANLNAGIIKKGERIFRGIDRIESIIKSLRSFSRLDIESFGQLDINRSLDEAAELVNVPVDRKIQFIKNYADIPKIECASNAINQCLLHIINNAVDAIDDNGVIGLKTTCDKESGHIIIVINDNGKGMSEEIRKQVFNPFFTTKPVGSGTGMGLSITERIIKRHKGKIECISKEGEGTTFTVSLPAGGLEPCDTPNRNSANKGAKQ